MRIGADQRHERRFVGIVRGRKDVIACIIRHLIDAHLRVWVVRVGDLNGVGDIERRDIDHLQRAVAVARPDLVADYDDTIRSRYAVVCRLPVGFALNASKTADPANVRVVAGIEEIDRPVGAIRQNIKTSLRVREADIERPKAGTSYSLTVGCRGGPRQLRNLIDQNHVFVSVG